MSLLGDVSTGANLLGIDLSLLDPFGFLKKKTPDLFGHDFPEGFKITEIVDGVDKAVSGGYGLVLIGNQMPFQPFSFGGEQKINKDYYPGNPEPVVQILGPRESSISIKGRLKVKGFKNPGGKKVPGGPQETPEAIQRQMDAIRIRGNLLRLQMGTWQRYGYLEKTHFDVSQIARTDYELSFSIVGFNPPTNCKFIDRTKEVPFAINKDLIAAANAFLSKPPPSTMPKSVLGILNGAISDVASAINLVTNFVDSTVKVAENAVTTVNRAKGLILNARANISRFKRRVRNIELSIDKLGSTFTDRNGGLGNNVGTVLGITNSQQQAARTTSTYSHANYIQTQTAGVTAMSAILARLHAQFDALSHTLPLQRYIVKQGDTLQKLAIKFYNNADKWKGIYDHNKMTTTVLSPSTIIEIPKP